MNLFQSLYQRIQQKIRSYVSNPENMLIHWSDFSKARLILFFGIMSQFDGLKWYLISYYSDNNRQWLDINFFQQRLTSVSVIFLVFIILFVLCFKLDSNAKFRIFIAYFAPILFGMAMIYSGYTIGIYSPATMAGFVSIVLVGLVFYSRKILYSVAIPVLMFTIVTCYLTSNDLIRYAPVFSTELNNSNIYQNRFWVVSMLQLYLPILIVSILFFEILLTQWRNREKYFEMGSKIDGLTNLYNRRHITEVLNHLEIKKESEYAVILMDLDHFKSINDQYGHEIGDRVLVQISAILARNVREQDTVGRFGGEEFILILNQHNLEDAYAVAERCRLQIQEQQIDLNNGESFNITASFGVALSKDNIGQDQIIRWADQALYLAKEKGRNQVRQCSELKIS